MDNLTHSLIGLIAGESLARSTRGREPGLAPDVRRGLFVAIAVIGGNLPDLDLLYSYHGASHDPQNKLSYMLQHRGYTHTVLGCLVLTLLLYAGAEWWARRKRLTLTGHDRLALAGMSLFGTFLHLAMDFLNSYGVHPFWPVENRWFYGDSVFIVEPLYWAAAATLFFVVRSWAVRVILALAPIAAAIVGFLFHILTLPWSCGLVLLTAALLAVGSRVSARAAAVTSAAVMVSVTAMFIIAGWTAAHRIDAIAAEAFPNDRVIDHVLTPAPANPLCWDVLVLATRGDRYTIRHGMLSDWPAVMSARQCPRGAARPADAVPVTPVAAADSGRIHWLGEFAMSTNQLAQAVAGHCEAAALTRFARAPFVAELERQWMIGDFRFAGVRGGGMAEIPLGSPSTGPCPSTAPWTPPRRELLK